MAIGSNRFDGKFVNGQPVDDYGQPLNPNPSDLLFYLGSRLGSAQAAGLSSQIYDKSSPYYDPSIANTYNYLQSYYGYSPQDISSDGSFKIGRAHV